MVKKIFTALFFIVIGMIIMGLGVWIMMPKMMLTTYKSGSSYEETIDKLRIEIETKKDWKIPKEFDFQKNIQDAGHGNIEKVGSIAICNPKYASMILAEDSNRKVTAIMPLTIGVYEEKNGQVYVSELNIGLMGMMFGGTIAKVMDIAGKDVNKIILAAAKK